MKLRVGSGPGFGFGRLPGGLDILAVFALSAHSQFVGNWTQVYVHTAAATALLIVNLRLPWPRVFFWSVVITGLAVFLGNLLFPVPLTRGHFENYEEQAAFYAMRRLSSLIYGFAWLFSTTPARMAATLHRIVRTVSSQGAIYCSLLVGLFPRILGNYADLRLSIQLRLRRDVNQWRGKGVIAGLYFAAKYRTKEFRILAIGTVLRLVELIPDLGSSLHTYGPRCDALPLLQAFTVGPSFIRSRGVDVRGVQSATVLRGESLLLGGTKAEAATAFLEFCSRLVPLIEGEAAGELTWNGISLLSAEWPLSRTQGRMAHLSSIRGTTPLGVTVEQHLALAGVSASNLLKVADQWGLTDLLLKPIDNLSGGQKRKALLAALLSTGAELITLDEPFAELDGEARLALVRTLEESVNRGRVALVGSDTTGNLASAFPDNTVLDLDDGGGDRSFHLPALRQSAPEVLYEPISAIDVPGRQISLQMFPPLSVTAGCVVVLKGPNGVGKSTVLYALAGAQPSSLSRLPPKTEIGYIFQDVNANHASLTVRSEIEISAPAVNRVAEGKSLRDALLEYLSKRLDAQISDLSTFEKRLLALYTMSAGTRVMLIDEPDAYLSHQERETMSRLILAFAGAGYAVVVATHSPELTELADSCVIVSRR